MIKLDWDAKNWIQKKSSGKHRIGEKLKQNIDITDFIKPYRTQVRVQHISTSTRWKNFYFHYCSASTCFVTHHCDSYADTWHFRLFWELWREFQIIRDKICSPHKDIQYISLTSVYPKKSIPPSWHVALSMSVSVHSTTGHWNIKGRVWHDSKYDGFVEISAPPLRKRSNLSPR